MTKKSAALDLQQKPTIKTCYFMIKWKMESLLDVELIP